MDNVDIGIALGFTLLGAGFVAAALNTGGSVNLNAFTLNWEETWRSLGPSEYANMVTLLAYPETSLETRRETPEWKAVERIYRRLDWLIDTYRECIKHTRSSKLCKASVLFEASVEIDYRLVYAAIKKGDTSKLTSSQRFALKQFMASARGYSEIHRAFEPGGLKNDHEVPVQSVADALLLNANQFETYAKDDLSNVIHDEEMSLQRLKVKAKTAKDTERLSVRELELQGYYNELRLLNLRHSLRVANVDYSRDWLL